MLKINGKTFMNLQEAVQWLLDNNALPFQSSANYVANTEIGMGTIVNPSPAKVRIGSLIFFADSKVSTVVGLTENGFIVSNQYNDLVDDVVYVSNVALNASGHLIVTLSNGDTIDAGLIKQVSNFSINASQHLIASYNDGTSTDLGAIFSGNVNIAGNFTANSIIEIMTGYSFAPLSSTSYEVYYAGVVKTGNKITFVVAGVFGDPDNALYATERRFGNFYIPAEIGAKLVPLDSNYIDLRKGIIGNSANDLTDVVYEMWKPNNTTLQPYIYNPTTIPAGTRVSFRYEATFLLSDNLVKP